MTTAQKDRTTSKLFDSEEVKRAIDLIAEPDEVFELRLLNATTSSDRRWTKTYSGYFDDPEKAIVALGTMVGASGCYITLNPVDSSLLARANNRFKRADKGDSTKDKEITRRRRLLIDFDANRATGISATVSEKQAAKKMSESVDLFLHDLGWPDSIIGDSGNGIHLIYGIDLPIDDNGLIENCLKALDQKFSNSEVKVDATVHNPARITKLYGTLVCKGDHTTDRPHRMSRILEVPETLQAVPQHLLAELAALAHADPKTGEGTQHTTNGQYPGTPFDLAAFIARNGLDVDGPAPYEGGQCWEFRTSPMCDHHGDGPFVIQEASGKLRAGCHHDSCTWGWKDLRQQLEPKQYTEGTSFNYAKPLHPKLEGIEKFTLAELQEKYPKLPPPVIDGLVREGETLNIIAPPKAGKSWQVYGLALSVITGKPWLETFPAAKGRVLLIDNELHRATIANRLARVGEAMGLFPNDYNAALDVWPLRGNLCTLFQLGADFDAIEHGYYKLIILDAKYRFATPGVSENDNDPSFYNLLDQYAEQTGAVMSAIHHSSKGSQSDKRVTDVGAGGGVQSRAADCHLILREHEDEDVFVLDAAVRSFPPVEPIALRWNFPLWQPAYDIDPTRLRRNPTGNEQRQAAQDAEGTAKISTAIADGSWTARQLRPRTGFGRERLQRLLDQMQSDGSVVATETTIRGNETNEYSLPSDE